VHGQCVPLPHLALLNPAGWYWWCCGTVVSQMIPLPVTILREVCLQPIDWLVTAASAKSNAIDNKDTTVTATSARGDKKDRSILHIRPNTM
jgi:hypothetical protein